MLDRDQLETFAVTVEEQSFERASIRLNVTRGAVSQRIKALEERLATVLLLRTSPVVPTQSGELLMHHVKALRILEGATLAKLNPRVQGGTHIPVAIAVNEDSFATWIPDILWPILKKLPIALEVVADNQDHTMQRIIRGEVIGCVSTQFKTTSGFVIDGMGAMEYRCYASAEFIDQWFPKGFTAQSASKAPAVLFDRKDRLHDTFLRQVFGFHVENHNRHYFPSPQALLSALQNGVGYGVVPAMQVEGTVHQGSLIDLTPEHKVDIPLYWYHWTTEPELSQDLTRSLLEGARSVLKPIANLPVTDSP